MVFGMSSIGFILMAGGRLHASFFSVLEILVVSAFRAAELFRDAQRIPAIDVGEDVYVANRLIDLYSGPLADPGRALVELRRLIDKYPRSAAAGHARDALSALKPLHLKSTDS
jgi:hypothetical protein